MRAAITESRSQSSALRAFAVLECVIRTGMPVSLDDITRACNLPKPTVYRILGMLREAELVRRDPLSKRYSLGPRMSQLAVEVMRRLTSHAQCHAVLQDLVDKIGESCNLTILDGNEVLYVDRVETTLPLRLHLDVGTRVPLHCSSSGKIFLSQMSTKQIHRLIGRAPLARYTDRTITNFAKLRVEIRRTRAMGLGIHDSEFIDASIALSVPVSDARGRVYAALAVHAPSCRMNLESAMKHVVTLRRAAKAIASILTPASTRAMKSAAAHQSTDMRLHGA